MSTTESNLKEAFAGESQANRKYLAFAKKAEQEGFANVARLFRTAAEAETVHALGHLAALEGVGSTADNLRAAVAGETYEFKEMYPPMLQQATAEGHRAKRMFEYALKAETVHGSTKWPWMWWRRERIWKASSSTCAPSAAILSWAGLLKRAPSAAPKGRSL